MDRAMIEEHLAQADRHVTEGERHLARQRELLAQMQPDDPTAAEARKLLDTFENLLASHIADRDRLKGELAALGQINK
jgi:hypothetical protein